MNRAALIVVVALLPACAALHERHGSHEHGHLERSHSHAEHGRESAEENGMEIGVTSVFVRDQSEALRFYTEVLGFVKKTDVPVGEFRWLTVVSATNPQGVELLLEPNAHPAAETFQDAIRADGIPATTFFVDDLEAEYERLLELGVEFTRPPTEAGGVSIAVFDDTCGNLIQLTQV